MVVRTRTNSQSGRGESLGLGEAFTGKATRNEAEGRKLNMKAGGIVGLVVVALFVIFGLSVVFGSWYTIDATERGVLLQNGAISAIVQPGWHGKWPWINSVAKVDMQTHTITYGQDNQGKSIMEAYSADQQPAHLRVSVTMHISPDKVKELYSRFGGDIKAAENRLVAPHVFAETKNVFGQYTAQRAITDRAKLNTDVDVAIKKAISYDPVFDIDSVQVEDITFSPDYIRVVEQRMQAEVQVQQQQQLLAQEKIKADIAVAKATGEANSTIAVAKANAQKTILEGNAAATAIKAKADALAKNENLIELTKAERWDGKLPTTMVPGSSVPFMNVGPQGISVSHNQGTN